MALDDDILFLRRIPTFRVLGPDALRVLAISAEKTHLRSGDTLFEEGEPADGAFIVLAGAVRLKRAKDKPLDEPQIVRGGTLIGESALIIETDRAATAHTPASAPGPKIATKRRPQMTVLTDRDATSSARPIAHV